MSRSAKANVLALLAAEAEAVTIAQQQLLEDAAACTDARIRAFLLEVAAQHEQQLITLDQRAETLAALI